MTMISFLEIILEGLTWILLIVTLPLLQASVAMLLVLKILTDHRNLSILIAFTSGIIRLLFILNRFSG